MSPDLGCKLFAQLHFGVTSLRTTRLERLQVSGGRTYLDHNASAPLLAESLAAMSAVLDLQGNPSSIHAEGRKLRAIVEAAREDVAALVGSRPSEIVFTSGASEANATVLSGGFSVAYRPATEHDSVLAPIARSGARTVTMPVSSLGIAEVVAFEQMLASASPGAGVVAIQAANNETGVIQPVAEIAAIARSAGLHVHCDATQAPGRMPVDVAAWGVDTLAISAHKLGGPKGIGAIVVREDATFTPLIAGGGQERRRRAGTENVSAIAGFGAAARVALANLGEVGRVAALRDRLEAGVRSLTPQVVVIGVDAPRLSNTTSISLPGRSAEIEVIKLDLAGIAVGAGAACSSGKVGVSHVLAAMGLDPAIARGAIRISLGPSTVERDVEQFLQAWAEITGFSRLARGQSDPLPPIRPIINVADDGAQRRFVSAVTGG